MNYLYIMIFVAAIAVLAGILYWGYSTSIDGQRQACQSSSIWYDHNIFDCQKLGIGPEDVEGWKEYQAKRLEDHDRFVAALKKEREAFVALCGADEVYYRQNFKKCFDAKEFGWYSNEQGGIFEK